MFLKKKNFQALGGAFRRPERTAVIKHEIFTFFFLGHFYFPGSESRPGFRLRIRIHRRNGNRIRNATNDTVLSLFVLEHMNSLKKLKYCKI
jgi:hypothetical protein